MRNKAGNQEPYFFKAALARCISIAGVIKSDELPSIVTLDAEGDALGDGGEG